MGHSIMLWVWPHPARAVSQWIWAEILLLSVPTQCRCDTSYPKLISECWSIRIIYYFSGIKNDWVFRRIELNSSLDHKPLLISVIRKQVPEVWGVYYYCIKCMTFTVWLVNVHCQCYTLEWPVARKIIYFSKSINVHFYKYSGYGSLLWDMSDGLLDTANWKNCPGLHVRYVGSCRQPRGPWRSPTLS